MVLKPFFEKQWVARVWSQLKASPHCVLCVKKLNAHTTMSCTTCCIALAVLWMALHKEKFPLLATSLQAAAGVCGHQRWALILMYRTAWLLWQLSSSKQRVVGFSRFSGMPPLPTCMLPQTLALLLIGSSARLFSALMRTAVFAVLHNRNEMVAAFGNSEWAVQSEGAVQSKSVTSCAGITAHFVLLAQTKVGFLSGGRSRRMKELPQKEVLAQLEEA